MLNDCVVVSEGSDNTQKMNLTFWSTLLLCQKRRLSSLLKVKFMFNVQIISENLSPCDPTKI